jgi:trehalose 6-phosphate synthase
MGREAFVQSVQKALGDGRLIVVSNREPCVHEKTSHGIRVTRPASGMVTGIEPIMRAAGGVWVAHGSGSADRLVVDAHDRVGVPEDNPAFVLRRVWLSRAEESKYYYGLANRSIWPLCHIAYARPEFSHDDWSTYKAVNRRFAEAVLDECRDKPAVVFVQDYHLALLPRMLREARPDLTIAQFWHIPWPNREAFRIFPWGEELLDGLLGNDLLGFHIQYHCMNFLSTIDRAIEARVDYERFRVFRGGRPTTIRAFPISVDFDQIGADSSLPLVDAHMSEFVSILGTTAELQKIFIGADRLDYTKGIPERFRAFDMLLRKHSELRGRVVLLQLGVPSRTHLTSYRDLNDELDDIVDDINWRHQSEDWQPIRFLREHHGYHAVLAAYRLALVALVTSLHDGMNLVAKEFVSTRTDGDGVLLLSEYTGASRELSGAVLVNPFDVEGMADSMYEALSLSEEERRERMSRMREQVGRNDSFRWGRKIFEEIARLKREPVTVA